ncbi:hypothetical protein [Anaerorhabdus sp.]|uniref:hypothetical protein n=1 Tax=Anaerorhabdus sp. TaxID=1872524 RepID=UPI002FC67EF3
MLRKLFYKEEVQERRIIAWINYPITILKIKMNVLQVRKITLQGGIKMYLDAVFSISLQGIEAMKKIDNNARLDYLLGIGEDDSFTKHMINIGDFGITANIFYYLLLSPELNLSELDEVNTEELFIDEYFHVLHLNKLMVKSLNKKLQDIELDYIKNIMDGADIINLQPICSAYEKFLEFKDLIKEAVLKKADLLLVIRFK